MKISTRHFRDWIPVLIWISVIIWESFRLSSNVTGGWMWRLFHLLHLDVSMQTVAEVNHVLRKAGHVSGYGILCLLVFRACFHTIGARTAESNPARIPSPQASESASRHRSFARIRSATFAISVTLITAVLDEWHQSFDPSRTSSGWDVAIDMTGALVFLGAALFVLKVWPPAGGKVETISA